MKRILYIMAIFLLASIASNAQYTKRIVISNGNFDHKMTVQTAENSTVAESASETVVSTSPFKFLNNMDFLLLEDATNAWTPFRTRLHPYYDNTGKSDTAIVLKSITDPSKNGDNPIGYILIPQKIGQESYMNGYAQIIPSMTYYYPQCKGGDFTIDTVSFLTYPSNTATGSFIFTMMKMTVPKIATSAFTGMRPQDLDKIMAGVTTNLEISPEAMNGLKNPDGTLNPLILTTESISDIASYKSDSTIGMFFFKSSPGDTMDKVYMIGAWEWGLKASDRLANCYAATVNHYPTGKDTVSLMSSLVWTYKDFNAMKASYPALAALANTAQQVPLRYNLNFTIYGTYNGPIDTDVKEVEAGSDMFSLSQNYPNPVMNNTNIRFSTKEFSKVTLNLYNSVGQLVHMLIAKDYMPGTYDVDFDASNLQAGTYFYTMTIGSFSKTLPMTIAR